MSVRSESPGAGRAGLPAGIAEAGRLSGLTRLEEKKVAVSGGARPVDQKTVVHAAGSLEQPPACPRRRRVATSASSVVRKLIEGAGLRSVISIKGNAPALLITRIESSSSACRRDRHEATAAGASRTTVNPAPRQTAHTSRRRIRGITPQVQNSQRSWIKVQRRPSSRVFGSILSRANLKGSVAGELRRRRAITAAS